MALYLISYDLMNHATFGQYETLISELRKLGAQRVLLSEWLLRSNRASVDICKFLMNFIHANDRLLVSEITTNWSSYKVLVDINQM